MSAPDNYCREVEAYLCRRNQGHLIRIVGPAFELVSAWAQQGIPLSVVCAGIDRTVERHDRKTTRRRPVRIEFCEADVLDAFDAWRRAVGVNRGAADRTADDIDAGVDESRRSPRRPTLVSHLDRAMARLTTLRGSDRRPAALDAVLDRTVRAIDGLRAVAPQARGETRVALIAELETLDRALVAQLIEALEPAARAAAEAEGRQALAPYRDRMTEDAYQRALSLAVERHVRGHVGLPVLSYDAD